MFNLQIIPIPMLTQVCRIGCCRIKFCPLVVAFGRTIHSFQGQEAGPDKPIKRLVVNPGAKRFETSNLGTLNCCITRATTLGGQNIKKSALFFCGPHITYERFHNMTKSVHGKTYEKIEMRNMWIKYLSQQILDTERKFLLIPSFRIAYVKKRIKVTLTLIELDEIIQFHIDGAVCVHREQYGRSTRMRSIVSIGKKKNLSR